MFMGREMGGGGQVSPSDFQMYIVVLYKNNCQNASETFSESLIFWGEHNHPPPPNIYCPFSTLDVNLKLKQSTITIILYVDLI